MYTVTGWLFSCDYVHALCSIFHGKNWFNLRITLITRGREINGLPLLKL